MGCFSPYSNIRPSGYPPRTRPASSISANLAPPSRTIITNVRKGLTRSNPLLTISPDSSWIEDINRRTLQQTKQNTAHHHHHHHQHNHFASKPFINQTPALPLHSAAYFGGRGRGSTWQPHHPNSMNPSEQMYPPVQTVSNSTSRHHLSFNDLLVRAYILNNNKNK